VRHKTQSGRAASASATARFGGFELNLRSAELRKNGHLIRLQEQPFQILLELLRRPGEVVTREEIRKKLWADDTVVEFDHSINAAVKRLRDSLQDSAESPRYVETFARRGYRFIAPVSWDADPSPPARRRWGHIMLAAAAAVGVLAIVLAVVLFVRKNISAPVDVHVAPLTSNAGLELHPAFSPDGTRVAYSWSMPPGQKSAIYVKLHGPGDALKLTGDLQQVVSPVWSPDGRWIAALQDLGQVGVIVLIPASGGQFKELIRVTKIEPGSNAGVDTALPFMCGVGIFGSALSWSHDGKYLFASAKRAPGSPFAIVRVAIETGEMQPITSPPKDFLGDFGPAVSPDGRHLAFARFRFGTAGDLYITSLSYETFSRDKSARRITTESSDIRSPVWTPDSRELIFSSDRDRSRALWRIPAGGGTPVRLPGIGEDAIDVALSQSGKTLVYNRARYSGSLWKIPISNGKAGTPVRVTATTARDKFPSLSPDGKRVAFESDRSGFDEIWACDLDGRNAVQLTTFGKGISGTPRWSPDGRTIAFDGNANGSFDIYAIPSGGGQPVQLTRHPSMDVIPRWSQDGEWIYFTSWRTGRAEVWKVRADGRFEVQVTRDEGALAAESADGKDLYFVRGTDDAGDLFRMPVGGGEATKVMSPVRGRLFSGFAKGIYFTAGSPQAELRYLEFATGSVHAIVLLPGMPYADVSPDERWALYSQPAMSDATLVVAENFR
jgi:Tol biopolymer transport system component/DNA-binding winged helix-turn-helix (wHTH) protein